MDRYTGPRSCTEEIATDGKWTRLEEMTRQLTYLSVSFVDVLVVSHFWSIVVIMRTTVLLRLILPPPPSSLFLLPFPSSQELPALDPCFTLPDKVPSVSYFPLT